MCRRALGDAPFSIRLDHGDLLVMDGLGQPEHEHRMASGLQGLLVNLTYRWVTQHIASCPLAGAMSCTFPSCVQGFAEPDFPGEGTVVPKWAIFLGDGLPCVNFGVLPFEAHSDSHGEEALQRLSASIPPGVALTFLGRCALGWVGVGDCRGVVVIHKDSLFVLLGFLQREETMFFLFQEPIFLVLNC